MTCGKIPYPSRHAAKTALRIINKHNRQMHLKDVYYCEPCSAWHTTSTKKSRVRWHKRHGG